MNLPNRSSISTLRPIREEAVRYWDTRQQVHLEVPIVFRDAGKRCVHRCRRALKQLKINIGATYKCARYRIALVTAARVAQDFRLEWRGRTQTGVSSI